MKWYDNDKQPSQIWSTFQVKQNLRLRPVVLPRMFKILLTKLKSIPPFSFTIKNSENMLSDLLRLVKLF